MEVWISVRPSINKPLRCVSLSQICNYVDGKSKPMPFALPLLKWSDDDVANSMQGFPRLISHIVPRDAVTGCLPAVIRTLSPRLVAYMASPAAILLSTSLDPLR